MKSKFYLLMAMMVAIIGCNKEFVVEEVPSIDGLTENCGPDSTVVKLGIIGDFTPSPMTKTLSTDLYALQVYTEYDTGTGIELRYYAMGVYDDLNNAVIKLPKDNKFSFVLAYIPHGKTRLQTNGLGWGNPCRGYFTGGLAVNTILYTTEEDLAVENGTSQKIGAVSPYTIDNWWNDVERYQGYVTSVDPTEVNVVNIELKSMMIGFNITIEDFHSGLVTLKGEGPYPYSVGPHLSGTSNLEVIIEAPYMAFPFRTWMATQVKIIYTDVSGDNMCLMDRMLNYEFNTMYNLTFSLSDAITNGGITATVVDEEMKSANLI